MKSSSALARTAWRPPPPAPRSGSWRSPGRGSSSPPPPTLATQLNNGDIAGPAAAPRPPLPLTRAGPWACGRPGAGSGRGGVRASSRDSGQPAGSSSPGASQPERSRRRADRREREVGGERGEGAEIQGLLRPRPSDGHARAPPTGLAHAGSWDVQGSPPVDAQGVQSLVIEE